MIIIKISGGLGNQMFQYASARAIAEKRNDTFKVDLSFYPKQSLRNYELNHFNITESIATKKESMKLSGCNLLLCKVLRRVGLKLRPTTYYKEKEATVFDECVFDYEADVYLDGFWQNERYFMEIRDEVLKDFTPKQNISKLSKHYLTQLQSCASVSLHVRRGDYVANSHTRSVHGVCSLAYYKEAIEYIESKIDRPVFFIFSDDIPWCKNNLYFIKEKYFIENTKSAIEDLELMKHCQHNIIANSSFSWWGAWLNKNPTKIIISPKKWINHNPRDHKWVPHEWLQI